MIEVLKKGMLTCLVSGRRHGRERLGVPTGGPMDSCLGALANRLVGNGDTAPLLEAVMVLPTLRFETDCAFAVAAGACCPELLREGERIPVGVNRTVFARRGDVLIGGALEIGFRAYIAVAGGFETCGASTRRLEDGDRLFTGEADLPLVRSIEALPLVMPGEQATLRVLEGAHAGQFTRESLALLHRAEYVYTPQSDRMGIRFSGPELSFRPGCDGNILSEAVIAGDIQVTSAGQPILMMMDCQTVGGYTKAAHVITADLPVAAQLRPGARVRFRPVLMPEAQAAWRKLQYRMECCVPGIGWENGGD